MIPVLAAAALAAGIASDASGAPPAHPPNDGDDDWKKRRLDAFNTLANDQRGEPEEAMHALQHAQISQLYGWVCEHVGDLTHRMAHHFDWFNGYEGGVHEKTKKTLQALENRYGFEREVNEQIAGNLRYRQDEGRPSSYASPEEGKRQQRQLGQAYADAHKKLVVWNEVQWLAREAAIAMGEHHFWTARRLLQQLLAILDSGDEGAWERRSGEFTGEPYALDRQRAS